MLHISVIFKIKIMDYSLISHSPLFKGLVPEETLSILSGISFRTKKYRAGSMIAQAGEPVTSLMVVLEGRVRGEMVDFAGRVIKIEDIPAPGALASAFLFGSANRFPVNIISVTDSGLLLITKDEFIKLLMLNDNILLNFLNIISNRSQFLSEKIKFLSFKTIKGKLSHYILQKAGPDGDSIVMDMTQTELAGFFGVARESIARALHDLDAEGCISSKGKRVRIIDRRALASYVGDH